MLRTKIFRPVLRIAQNSEYFGRLRKMSYYHIFDLIHSHMIHICYISD